MKNLNVIKELATDIYGAETGNNLLQEIQKLLKNYRSLMPMHPIEPFDQKDVILITYADMVKRNGQLPLETLAAFLNEMTADVINGVHILPFFPYSSDDGFSVIDFKQVDASIGEWKHIREISQHFKLMVDLVINHISANSAWFQGFLRDEMPFNDFFITVDGHVDLSAVVRPRALPLLTEVETARGKKKVWTTFSADQIDLNYRNPQVLLAMLEVMLHYVQMGADIIRLDAVAYIWKEIGTPCIHLTQAHRIVQLMRALLDEVASWVVLVTETNVPHNENISYFGDGSNEAQMVYNFSLPPLVLHTFISQDAGKLSKWAENLEVPSEQTAFFNFLASHDGIGITPALGILNDGEIDAVIGRVQTLGGKVSYKNSPDGTKSPYELNINFLDALGLPGMSDEPPELTARRFLTSQAIMLALRGVPGCYFHSLVGSHGWSAGIEGLGHTRAVNREKLDDIALRQSLSDETALRSSVFNGYRRLLKQRRQQPAFHPQGGQRILHIDKAAFVLMRSAPNGLQHILCLHNVSGQKHILKINMRDFDIGKIIGVKSLLGNTTATLSGQELNISLSAYETAWLEIVSGNSSR